jgi:hypothetical protein
LAQKVILAQIVIFGAGSSLTATQQQQQHTVMQMIVLCVAHKENDR